MTVAADEPIDGPTPATGLTRALRVAALGGASLLLAGGAHVAGGGRLPSGGVLCVVGLLLGLIALTVTVRRCRLTLLLAVLGAEQALLHLVFSAATAGARCGATLHGTTHPAGALDQVMSGCSVPVGNMAAAMATPGWMMWTGHAAATVATAWLLARGEAWLWRVVHRLVSVATAAPGARPSAIRRTSVGPEPSSILTGQPYASAAPRGPPGLIDS